METKERNASLIKALLCIIFVFGGISLSYLSFMTMTVIKVLMGIGLLLCLSYGGYLYYKKELTPDKAIFLLILAGMIMRLGYAMYTPIEVRQHDCGVVGQPGHAGYLDWIATRNRLPENNSFQFYHPPLLHLISAIPTRLAMLFTGKPLQEVIELAKGISVLAGFVVLWVFPRLMSNLGISKKTQVLSMAIIAFFPNQYLMFGRFNNDGLAAMFMVLALWFTVRWYQSRKLSDLLFTALWIGLGMMTKLSVSIMAFITGPVMLYVWYQNIREKKGWETFKQYLLFGGICAPLGLWHPIRNLIKFDQPLGYVLKIGPGNGLYRGDNPIIDRFFRIPQGDLSHGIFAVSVVDVNIPLYLLKTAVSGEYRLGNPSNPIFHILLYSSILLAVISFVFMIWTLCKGKELKPELRFGLPFTWLVTIVSFVSFNLSYPASCTQDFRYVPIVALLGAIYVGLGADFLKEKYPFLKKAIGTLTVIFCIASVLSYTVFIQN